MSTVLTNKNFEEEVMNAKSPVLIDFYADWCMPCKMLSPVIEEIAGEYTQIKVAKVNVDQEPELASKFNVMSIPTLVVMENGEAKATAVGVQPKQEILNMMGL